MHDIVQLHPACPRWMARNRTLHRHTGTMGMTALCPTGDGPFELHPTRRPQQLTSLHDKGRYPAGVASLKMACAIPVLFKGTDAPKYKNLNDAPG